MKNCTYKITWFNNKKQRVEDKLFTDYDKAVKWAKKTLTNYSDELIQTIDK